MLRKDLKTYLIVAKSERCCQEEYAYQHDVLVEFLNLAGDIPYAQLKREHITDLILQMMEESAAGELGREHMIKVRFTIERFLLWLQSQYNDWVPVKTVRN